MKLVFGTPQANRIAEHNAGTRGALPCSRCNAKPVMVETDLHYLFRCSNCKSVPAEYSNLTPPRDTRKKALWDWNRAVERYRGYSLMAAETESETP